MLCSIGKLPQIDGYYALLGFVILFAVLLAVAFVVKLLRKKKPQEAQTEAAQTEVTQTSDDNALAPGSSGEMTLYKVSEREAAMVIAIVADELQTPINELQFISIKKKSEERAK